MNKKIFFLFIFLYFTRIIFSKEIRYNLYIDLNIQIYKNNKKKIFTEYEKHIKQISFSNNSEKIVSNLFNYKNIFFKMKKNKTEFLIYLNNFYKNYNFLTYHDHLIFNSNFNIQSLNININYMRNKVQEFKCSILFLYHYRIKKFISFFSWGSGINYNIFTSTLNNSLSENNVLNIDNKYKYFYEQKNSITNKFFFFYFLSICIFSYRNNNFIINILYDLENNIKINSLGFLFLRKNKLYNFCVSAKYYMI